MRIEVVFEDGCPRVYASAGESALSSDSMAAAEVTGEPATRAPAALLWPRLDRLDEGLRVDVWWYSTMVDATTGTTQSADFDREVELYDLNLEAGRVWRVLSADELARAVSVDVDGRWRLERVGGELVNLTLFERELGYWCGEMPGVPLPARASALRAAILAAHPDWGDERAAEAMGMPPEALARLLADDRATAGDGAPAADAAPIVAELLREDPSLTISDAFLALNEGLPSEAFGFDDVRACWGEARSLAGLA